MNLVSRIINKILRPLKRLKYQNIVKNNQDLKRNIDESRALKQNYIYNNSPKISIIVQFFNKRGNIEKLIESLRLTQAEEIIIIDEIGRAHV